MKPHIVVLCLDTVRKDFYDRYATRLGDLASIRFDGMRALSSWSVPSHAGMLTGKVPSETGVHAYNRRFESIATEDTWLSTLHDRGYESVCVSANIYASPVFGFDGFFADTVVISPSRRLPRGLDVQEFIQSREDAGVSSYVEFLRRAISHEETVRSLLNGVLLKADDLTRRLPVPNPFDYGASAIASEIERRVLDSDGPQAVFANFMDAHGPHSPFRGLDHSLHAAPSNFHSGRFKDWDVTTETRLGEYEADVEIVRSLYSAEIDYLDGVIADMVNTIIAEASRDTVLIVTADHGENLGFESEEYMMNHVSSLSEALLHVPFDVFGVPDSETVDSLATHADLGALVRSLVDDDFDPMQFARNEARAEIVGSGSGFPEDGDEQYWDRGQRAVYRDGLKYYADQLGTEKVYDVSGPSCTQRELPDRRVPDGLFDEYFLDWVVVTGNDYTEELDESTKSRLKELGYL